MDLISSAQLSDYEVILQKINSEQEKKEKLEQRVEEEQNRIIAHKLSGSQQKYRFSHVTIKIFNTFQELYNLYENDLKHCDLPHLLPLKNCKFGLIEVFLTDALVSKLSLQEWKINISINNSCYNTNKTLNYIQKIPIVAIMPININDMYNDILTVSLFSCNSKDIIDVVKIKIDISYYFQSHKAGSSFENQINNIHKLYNREIHTEKIPQTHCEFYCDFKKSDFIAAVIKNSYHKLDLEMFSKFINEENVMNFHFFVNDEKVLISYNLVSKHLKIRSSCDLMLYLKRYFLQCSNNDYSKIQDKLSVLLSEISTMDESDLSSVIKFYQNMRSIWV